MRRLLSGVEGTIDITGLVVSSSFAAVAADFSIILSACFLLDTTCSC
jgi:hypothetical protein